MRKSKDVFIPSVVLDDIYDILTESICVAGNEDIYFDDIIWDIVRLLDEHEDVTQFLWEDWRNENNDGGIMYVSWIEKGRHLRHEHFTYCDYDEDLGHEPGKRNRKDVENHG